MLRLFTQRCSVEVVLVTVDVVLVDVVVVMMSQPLHVLAHESKKESHRSPANNCWHLAKDKVFVFPSHRCNVVVVDVVVVSHPLHVLSQSPGTLKHKPWAKIV